MACHISNSISTSVSAGLAAASAFASTSASPTASAATATMQPLGRGEDEPPGKCRRIFEPEAVIEGTGLAFSPSRNPANPHAAALGKTGNPVATTPQPLHQAMAQWAVVRSKKPHVLVLKNPLFCSKKTLYSKMHKKLPRHIPKNLPGFIFKYSWGSFGRGFF